MKKYGALLFLMVVLLFTAACNTFQGNQNKNKPEKPLTEKELIALNRRLMRREKKQINDFIRLQHWKMKETGTGLRYEILKHGTGKRAKTGEIAVIRYQVKLFDGEKVYSGIKTFKIGYGNVESGLEEGILLLKQGDVARFILPSHLAYGLSGDGNKIPPHVPIIYHVDLLKLK